MEFPEFSGNHVAEGAELLGAGLRTCDLDSQFDYLASEGARLAAACEGASRISAPLRCATFDNAADLS